MTRLICKLLGHRWQPVGSEYGTSVCLVCTRCRENGWRLRS